MTSSSKANQAAQSNTAKPAILDYSRGAKRRRYLPLAFMLVGLVLNCLIVGALSQVRYSWWDLGFHVGNGLVDFGHGYLGSRIWLARAAVVLLIAVSAVRSVLWYRMLNTAAVVIVLCSWFYLLYDFADWLEQTATCTFLAMCMIRTLHLTFAKNWGR